MGRNQQSKGGYARNKGSQPYASSKGGGQGKSKTVDAATALGLGVLQQNTMLSGMEGLQGLTQPIPQDSLFGSVGTNPLAGMAGLNTGLSSANA